jgi:hypothetical protein
MRFHETSGRSTGRARLIVKADLGEVSAARAKECCKG